MHRLDTMTSVERSTKPMQEKTPPPTKRTIYITAPSITTEGLPRNFGITIKTKTIYRINQTRVPRKRS